MVYHFRATCFLFYFILNWTTMAAMKLCLSIERKWKCSYKNITCNITLHYIYNVSYSLLSVTYDFKAEWWYTFWQYFSFYLSLYHTLIFSVALQVYNTLCYNDGNEDRDREWNWQRTKIEMAISKFMRNAVLWNA